MKKNWEIRAINWKTRGRKGKQTRRQVREILGDKSEKYWEKRAYT